jgi:hypothetical protein
LFPLSLLLRFFLAAAEEKTAPQALQESAESPATSDGKSMGRPAEQARLKHSRGALFSHFSRRLQVRSESAGPLSKFSKVFLL